jgi:IS605 OrfB family transposase
MKLIAQVRLYPTQDQGIALKQTLERANAACNWISEQAWQSRIFRRYDLQNLTYYEARARFGLSAQMVIRCLAKVADAYRLSTETKRTFRPLGSIAYDDRILSWYTEKDAVSIWSINGREYISYGAGERQRELLRYRQGETDLIYWNGMFFLLAVCDIPDPDERDVAGALGVDLGVTNIATTSDGDMMTNDLIEQNRQRMQTLRSDLQARGSLSAKRHLRELSGRQRRFQKDVNHVISKRLVETAQRTNRAIALEELTGIRARTRARGADQRARHSNWSFGQLRAFIAYKARLAGIPVILVDPAYTSQQCSCCGCVDKRHRRSQSDFLCLSCGHTAHADVNAAKNIASRATVISPMVSDAPLTA